MEFLSGIRVTAYNRENQKDAIRPAGYYILLLDYNEKKLQIIHFNVSKIDEANKVYNIIEKTTKDTNIDAVLVRVSSINSLRTAYPNYFSDIGEFIAIVNKYVGAN